MTPFENLAPSRAFSTTLLAASVLLAISLAPAPAQEPPASFGETVDVRVVNVDVYVTGKGGRPVTGLSRDDFLLFEDGAPVEISHFSWMGGAEPAAAAAGPDAIDAGAPAAPPPTPEPTTVVIYVDNSTMIQAHRNRVLDEVGEFAGRAAASGVPVTVVVFKPGLEILTPLTTEAELVRRALDEVAKMPAGGLAALLERRQVHSLIETIFANDPEPCFNGWSQMLSAVEVYAQNAAHRARTAQSVLLELTRSLGGVPGRKSVLYLSDGLEQQPGLDLFAHLGQICPRYERELISATTQWNESSIFQELAAYANAHRVTFYALDAAGLATSSAASVEWATAQLAPSPRTDTLRSTNLQGPLFIMADETGGRAFFNANRPDAELAEMEGDFSEYYSLGFAPPRGWDAKSHELRVELAQGVAKGVDLRYRRRYQAVPEQELIGQQALAALVLGREDNPLGASVALGAGQPAEKGVWKVPVRITIPVAALTTVPDSPGGKQLLRLVMVAEDGKGRRTPMREAVIPLGGEGPVAAGGSHTLVIHLLLEPGPHTIALALRDEASRVTSALRATVDVAAATTPGSEGRADGEQPDRSEAPRARAPRRSGEEAAA